MPRMKTHRPRGPRGRLARFALYAQAPPPQPPQPPPPLPGLVAEVKTSTPPSRPTSSSPRSSFPADKLTWQPTPAVRTWARLIGHITDDNNGACWALAGEAQAPARVDAADNQESPRTS